MKKKYVSALFFLLNILALASCANDHESGTFNQEQLNFQKMAIENAPRDANKAIADNDFRLLGVMGYSVSVPGTNLKTEDAEKIYGIRILKGTGDAITRSDQRQFNYRAEAYATKYNNIILKSKKYSIEK